EAKRMHAEDMGANQAMGRQKKTLMTSTGGVLTQCNAGALATAGYGTALGVIRAAVEFFSSRRRHTRLVSDWSSDVCSSDLVRSCLPYVMRPAWRKSKGMVK